MQHDVPHYIPPFIWRFWLSKDTSTSRIHVYNIYSSDLFEASLDELENVVPRPIFQDLNVPSRIYPAVQSALKEAEEAFVYLQRQAEHVLETAIALIKRCPLSESPGKRTSITLERHSLSVIVKFFTFLRFRNSAVYAEMVDGLLNNRVPYCVSPPELLQDELPLRGKEIFSMYHDYIQQVRFKKLFRSFTKFFRTDIQEMRRPMPTTYDIAVSTLSELDIRMEVLHPKWEPAHVRKDVWLEAFNVQCWDFCREADVFFGSASEEDGQEFILPDTCFGTLDEDFGGSSRGNPEAITLDAFFPISPTIALYIIQGGDWQDDTRPHTTVEVGEELYTDVHLRNAMVLSAVPYNPHLMRQPFITLDESFPPEELKPCWSGPSPSHPNPNHVRRFSAGGPRIYFCSLSSISRSISSYDLFRVRWMADTIVDYSHLKQRCRQKYLTSSVAKMLTVKGDVKVLDLTDEVKVIGKDPVGFGAFSDVWMGKWYDKVEGIERMVAIKYLRQVMVKNIREKFLKRLQAEVHIWHQLCHRNLASLYGLVQNTNSIGMVSPWCDNGTLCEYIKRNQSTNRLKLLIQVASGIAYLHHFVPPVVHGDLKAGNILVDSDGQAVITDFGLSKVMQDLTSMSDSAKVVPTSFFAGSTRWMSPELIQGLVEEEESTSKIPRVTTFSDVYAFASVCLEVITGELPYPHRKNDWQVTVDILRGVRPCRAAFDISCERLGVRRPKTCPEDQDALREFLDRCWNAVPYLRPKMTDAVRFLADLE